MEAQILRFCTTGRTYGQAVARAVPPPKRTVTVTIHFIQLMGRRMGGCGRSGSCRDTQLCTCSAVGGLESVRHGLRLGDNGIPRQGKIATQSLTRL
jgi:hypothetical protein